jgi:preprotein translocase subunit SecA
MEAYDMYQSMIEAIEEDAVRWVAKTPIPDAATLLAEQLVMMPPGVAVGPSEPGNAAPMVIPLFAGVPMAGMHVVLPPGVDPATIQIPAELQGQLRLAAGETAAPPVVAPPPPVPIVLPEGGADRIGRNDPCPCGSGKKYKRCHGQ